MTRADDVVFDIAGRQDVAAIATLLAEDWIGQTDPPDLLAMLADFDALGADDRFRVVVGRRGSAVVACYQLTVIRNLSLTHSCRAQLEGVRVTRTHRGQGIGARLMADAEARARSAGATSMQFTSNSTRLAAHRFYRRLGYVDSHTGFRKPL